MKDFGIIAKPLSDLFKKGQLFVWISITEQAFQALKIALTSSRFLQNFCGGN